ncbi:MAG: hypothetical protein GX424_01840 [Clostridiales bacterium]|nr:hypothetical protein [Clostridiales bacterium]
MWIAQRIIAAEKQRPAAELAQVTGNDLLQGAGSYRGVPAAAPWGVAYRPPNSARAVLVTAENGPACVGMLMEEKPLQPGELLLFSSGGAEIYLKNSGEIVLNGQVFAPKQGG